MDSDAQERQALQMRCNALQQQLTEGNERENTLRATIQVLNDVDAVRADGREGRCISCRDLCRWGDQRCIARGGGLQPTVCTCCLSAIKREAEPPGLAWAC